MKLEISPVDILAPEPNRKRYNEKKKKEKKEQDWLNNDGQENG